MGELDGVHARDDSVRLEVVHRESVSRVDEAADEFCEDVERNLSTSDGGDDADRDDEDDAKGDSEEDGRDRGVGRVEGEAEDSKNNSEDGEQQIPPLWDFLILGLCKNREKEESVRLGVSDM